MQGEISQLRTRVQSVCLITTGINYFNAPFMQELLARLTDQHCDIMRANYNHNYHLTR